jgi:hypothetical protein
MNISIKNINKHTSPLMSKLAVIFTTISTTITAWGAVINDKPIMYAGLISAVLGSVLPTLINHDKPIVNDIPEDSTIANSNGVDGKIPVSGKGKRRPKKGQFSVK